MSRTLYQQHCIYCDAADQLYIDGRKIQMTHMEQELFCYLLQHPNETLSRKLLLQEVWGYAIVGNSRTVDAHIKMLRQTLAPYSFTITTVHGVGYRLELDCTSELPCCAECCG